MTLELVLISVRTHASRLIHCCGIYKTRHLSRDATQFAMALSPSLPADRENQTFVTVQALSVGGLSLPHMNIFQDSIDAPLTQRYDIPFIASLITHPTRGKALFDLGLRKVSTGLYLNANSDSIRFLARRWVPSQGPTLRGRLLSCVVQGRHCGHIEEGWY